MRQRQCRTSPWPNLHPLSSEYDRNWKYVVDSTWTPRHRASWISTQDKIRIIGGDGNTDVWNSEAGKNWVCITETAPLGKRISPYVLEFHNKLWLMGGIPFWRLDGTTDTRSCFPLNDVWCSEDGRNWTLVIDHVNWSPCGLIHGSVVLMEKCGFWEVVEKCGQ